MTVIREQKRHTRTLPLRQFLEERAPPGDVATVHAVFPIPCEFHLGYAL